MNSQPSNLQETALQPLKSQRENDRLTKLKLRVKQMQNAIQQAESQQKENERRADVSRKIIIGGWCLAQTQKDANFAKYLHSKIKNDNGINNRQRLQLQPILCALELLVSISQTPPPKEPKP